jgi:hypothetical protein
MGFKTIKFEIQLEGRTAHERRFDKKDAIELARRTAKKYPDRAVRIVKIIAEYSEIDF